MDTVLATSSCSLGTLTSPRTILRQAITVTITVPLAVSLLDVFTSYLVLSPAVKCCAMLLLQFAGLHAVWLNAVLCCAVLCRTVLRFAVLRFAVLCCTVPDAVPDAVV